MFSARTLTPALIGVSLTAALVATPYRFTDTGTSKGLLPQTAAAQSDSEGSDTSSGDASQSSGESRTESEDTGATGANDTGQDGGQLSSDSPENAGSALQEGSDAVDEAIEQDGNAEPADDGNTEQAEPDQQEPTGGQTTNGETTIAPTEGAAVEVRYSNGMREEIRDGRYEMTDVQGRIIINRPATETDYARLLRAIGQ